MIKSVFSGSSFVLLAALGAGAATLSGVVRSGNGGGAAPVSEAKVVLMGFGGGGGGGQVRLDSATTDAQGRYRFDSVSTGIRQVVASKAGYQNGQAFANVARNNGSYTADIHMVALGGDGSGTVAGTVRAGSSQGAAVPGALVLLARVRGGGGSVGLDSARTDAQGLYRFDSVPASDNYILQVSAAGFNPAVNGNVEVDAGDTTTVDFSLTAAPAPARPGSIAGTVRSAGGGNPLEGAGVFLSRPGPGGGRIDSARTGSDGRYAFDSVAAGSNYIVTAVLAGFQSASDTDVDVVSNQTATVDLALNASGPAANRGGIAGKVVDAAGKGVAKATVVLSRPGPGGGSGALDTAATDASGAFAFDSVAALQNYTVTVSATGYQTAVNNNVDVAAGRTSPADFILVPSLSLRPDRSSGAGFRLAASRSSLAVEFASSPWAGRLSVYDSRGALALSAEVPAGAVRLTLPGKPGARFLVLERGGMRETLSAPPSR